MTDRYRYRAATNDGQVVEGVVQAPSQRTALEELRRQKLVPVDLAPVADEKKAAGRGKLGRVPALALFARTVATTLGAGMTLDRAIAFAARQARHPEVASAAREVHRDLEAGSALAPALRRHPGVFGPLFTAMVSAGEESGALDESIARLADHLDELVDLRADIRSSLIYPALMAFAAGAGTVVLLLFVVPRFAAMILEDGGALPLSTRLLVGVSALVVNGWWAVLILGLVLAFAGRSWLASPENRRRWHAWRLDWPLAGELEREYATARFTRAFGMLLRSGQPVIAALQTARATLANTHLVASAESATEAVSHGKPIHSALADTLPALATELLAVGEESGRLDDLCMRVADAYDGEVRRTLRSLVAVIEPALILLFGLVVGFIALAMLQAIYGFNVSAF